MRHVVDGIGESRREGRRAGSGGKLAFAGRGAVDGIGDWLRLGGSERSARQQLACELACEFFLAAVEFKSFRDGVFGQCAIDALVRGEKGRWLFGLRSALRLRRRKLRRWCTPAS